MIELSTLLPDAIGYIKTAGTLFKDTSQAVAPLIPPAKALWKWLTGVFAKDQQALDQLKAVEENPENPDHLAGLKYALQQHISNDPELQSQLADQIATMAQTLQEAPAVTQNYMENNSTKYGNIIQNFDGTLIQNIGSKKKSRKN